MHHFPEQLTAIKRATKGFFWTDQVKTCKDINQAWKILETEFANVRKLMDELLAEMNNLKHVKRDSKSLTCYATTISVFVIIWKTMAALFWRRQKLRSSCLSFYQSSIQNVSNLVTWLHQEATLRSRGKPDNDNVDEKERTHRGPTFRRTENHAASNDKTPDQEACPLGCAWKHHLAACPLYQSSTVNQRWDVVKQSKRCRKCLRPHYTNDCKKPDGTT